LGKSSCKSNARNIYIAEVEEEVVEISEHCGRICDFLDDFGFPFAFSFGSKFGAIEIGTNLWNIASPCSTFLL